MTNGKRINGQARSRMRNVQALLLVGLVLFIGCSDDEKSVGPHGDSSSLVFNNDCGFVITQDMLDRRFNEITFPGTHNSFTSECPDVYLTRNQGLSITDQLENGIRYIEFDLDEGLSVRHGSCFGNFNNRLVEIKNYAKAHPGQVITVRISDLLGTLATNWDEPDDWYGRVNGRLEDTDLDECIYNWNPAKPKHSPDRCYIPDPWPTLREMIESGRNVMFFHHAKCVEHDILDEGYCPGLKYSDTKLYEFYGATKQEQFCRLMPIWDPPQDRQADGPNRLFLIECDPDGGAPAGDKVDAAKNNDGRKLYQVAKQHETKILPDNRVVNFITVDYFMSSHAGHLPIDVVDACNRLNYERFGSGWEHSACSWELYPYEFDNSKVEHLSQLPAIQAEVAEVVADFKAKIDLDGHEDRGRIVSTTYHTVYDWKRLPEWAVDNDMFTRWCGSSSKDNHTWGIDLGEKRSINEIAIAWEFSHLRPAYSIYASNDDSRFANGISNSELLNDAGWQKVAQGGKQTNVDPILWDIQTFDGKRFIWPDSIDLLAGQHIDAGDVGFEVLDGELLVTYTSSNGWMMNTLHLWIGCDPDGYPQGRSGNPKIGHFPYVFDVAGGTSHTFVIDLTDPALVSCLGTTDDCEDGNLFYAMAHAEMFKDDGFGGYQTETGWADGAPAGGRNWAMIAAITVENDSCWRYFKIKITDADEHHWPSFWEVRLYGPAD